MSFRDRNRKFMFSSRHNHYQTTSNSVYELLKLDIHRELEGFTRKCDRKGEKGAALPAVSKSIEFDYFNMTSQDLFDDMTSHHTHHRRMLEDIAYVNGFWKAIGGNAHLFENKIVVETRCGLGVLSMFCAIAGAKHVYAIDTSNIVQMTRQIVSDNKLADKITVIKGNVDDISLPIERCDVIVSSFFGQSIFCHNGLDELLNARDKWLAPNGIILPDQCTLYVAAMKYKSNFNRSNFWQNVYQFTMQPITQAVATEPYLMRVKLSDVRTNSCPIKHLNLYTLQKADYQQFDAIFQLEAIKSDHIQAFFTYFDVQFTHSNKRITLSNAPGQIDGLMNWTPMVFYLDCRDELYVECDEKFYGIFRMKCIDNKYRSIDWNFEVCQKGRNHSLRDRWLFKTR